MIENEVLLIGVDGGATEAKAHAVACDDLRAARGFSLRPERASRIHPRLERFVPLAVADQLGQRDAGAVQLTDAEREQGELWINAAVEAVAETAAACGADNVLVGIGMPGLKTPDGRGINVINNGPRMPDYLDQLERGLKQRGVSLAAPVAALGSDADYCGLGEQYAADGLFRDVRSAYYAGCGTGIADAMKLRGELVPFDRARTWIQKSWQMPSALGPTFEKLVSASALNRIYAAFGAEPTSVFPEVAARQGAPLARQWLAAAALVLAELIFERLATIYGGRADAPHRGEAYAKLEVDHAYRGTTLDRVVIGQRVGLLYADEPAATFRSQLDQFLAAFLSGSSIASVYLDQAGQLRPGLVHGSRLRSAPALGAAVAAARALTS